MSLRISTGFVILLLGQLAGAFSTETHVQVTPNLVTAQACNSNFNQTIICRTTAYGQFANGFWIDSWVNLPLAPGQCDSAYVYNRYPQPSAFVSGSASAECDFLRNNEGL